MCSDGKALLTALQQPLSPESENSVTAQTNYSHSAGHFLDLIHEVLQQHRELDEGWQRKKTIINQRVQLCVFQHDTAQVGLYTSFFKVAALSFKPDIRLCANQPCSERISQSNEHKNYFGTRSCVRANLVSIESYIKFEGCRSDFKWSIPHLH